MRQILRYMYSIVLLCFITSAIVAPVCAEDAIPADEADKFASAREISLLTEDPPVDGIQCFAVSDSGLFALGLGVRVSGTMTVAVYSQDCVFNMVIRSKAAAAMFSIFMEKTWSFSSRVPDVPQSFLPTGSAHR